MGQAEGEFGGIMEPQSIIVWLIVGAIAGWLAGMVVKGGGFGLIGDIIVGIVGAFIAGWLLPRDRHRHRCRHRRRDHQCLHRRGHTADRPAADQTRLMLLQRRLPSFATTKRGGAGNGPVTRYPRAKRRGAAAAHCRVRSASPSSSPRRFSRRFVLRRGCGSLRRMAAGSPPTSSMSGPPARLVLSGHAAAAYDWPTHKLAEDAALGHAFDGYFGWHYPPPFLFVAAALASLPYTFAYLAWTAGTFLLYLAAIRTIIGDRIGYLLAAAFPPVLANFFVGQNGFLSAALFGGTLVLIERRQSILAGVLLGLLSLQTASGPAVSHRTRGRRPLACDRDRQHCRRRSWRSRRGLRSAARAGSRSSATSANPRRPSSPRARRIGASCKPHSAWCVRSAAARHWRGPRKLQ